MQYYLKTDPLNALSILLYPQIILYSTFFCDDVKEYLFGNGLLSSFIMDYIHKFMDKKIKLSFLSMFLAAALIGSVVTFGDNMAYAGGKNTKSNDLLQLIEQSSITGQDSECFSEQGNTIASCNNLAFTLNLNDGNNAAAQQ